MRWSAWLCLSLTLWTATAELAHNHPNPGSEAACSICQVAQTSNPSVRSGYTAPVLHAVGRLHEEQTIAPSHLYVLDLGIRGPPVA